MEKSLTKKWLILLHKENSEELSPSSLGSINTRGAGRDPSQGRALPTVLSTHAASLSSRWPWRWTDRCQQCCTPWLPGDRAHCPASWWLWQMFGYQLFWSFSHSLPFRHVSNTWPARQSEHLNPSYRQAAPWWFLALTMTLLPKEVLSVSSG